MGLEIFTKEEIDQILRDLAAQDSRFDFLLCDDSTHFVSEKETQYYSDMKNRVLHTLDAYLRHL